MKVLVIGSGGREHAIVDKISESKYVDKIYVAPGNDMMKDVATLVDISVLDTDSLLEFALSNKIDLTIVGPEVSLERGIVNLFRKHNLNIFGPTKEASQIETSKSFAKDLMKKYNIPTASYKTFDNYNLAYEYIINHGVPLVIKYDGLAQGKGVVVAHTLEEAINAIKDMLLFDKYGKSSVVIEDYLEGPEFSFMCFVDNENVYPLPLSQDHKRAFDNDLGLNTGGMGAYTGLSFINNNDYNFALNNILKPCAKALVKENCSFTGVLYGGLIKTKDGIKVIEFNARFGDPETEVVLPGLKSDLYVSIMNILNHKNPNLVFDNAFYMGVVLASNGYPLEYEKNHLINILDKIDGKVYYMGVKENNGNIYTNGGRVLIVVNKASNLKDAYKNVYNDVSKIKCDNLFYRKDIGHWSL